MPKKKKFVARQKNFTTVGTDKKTTLVGSLARVYIESICDEEKTPFVGEENEEGRQLN